MQLRRYDIEVTACVPVLEDNEINIAHNLFKVFIQMHMMGTIAAGLCHRRGSRTKIVHGVRHESIPDSLTRPKKKKVVCSSVYVHGRVSLQSLALYKPWEDLTASEHPSPMACCIAAFT